MLYFTILLGGRQDGESREVACEIGGERLGIDGEKEERRRGERVREQRTEAKEAEKMEGDR